MNALPIGVSLAAQQPAPAPGTDMGFFVMMGIVFAIFYFLVIRPQAKQKRELEQAVKSAAKGDHVVTTGGLHGKIVATDDATFTVEVATLKGGQSVRVQVSRARVDSVSSKKAASGDSESSQKESKRGGS